MAEITIYALRDPRDNEVRYIGQTQDVEMRYRQHIRNNVKYLSPKNVWIEELQRGGFLPLLDILEVVSDDRADEAERRWIEKFNGGDQCRILNITVRGVHNRRYRRTKRQTKQRGIVVTDELDERVYNWGAENGHFSWSQAAAAILAAYLNEHNP